MPPRICPAIFTAWLIVAPLGAQYNPPGTSVADRDVTDEEELRSGLEEASWRLGVLRLQPWIGIRDASFVTSSTDDETDVTASAGAGVRAYVKTGPKVVWAAHALPEYVWWRNNDAKRRLNGRYGLGLFAFFNHLDLELSARRSEVQGFFSSEVQELTTTRRDLAHLGFELALGKRVAIFGARSLSDLENQEDGSPRFSLLDQRIETSRIGLRYRTPGGLSIGGGVEETANEFDREARNLSNTGAAAFLEVGYEGRRFGMVAAVERRTLRGREGSDFTELEVSTGYLESSWRLHRAVDLLLYGRRQLGYSIASAYSNILGERAGTRLDVKWRDSLLYVTAELGRDEFKSFDPAAPERADDVLAFGFGLTFVVRSGFAFSTALIHSRYDSSLPGFDRDVTAWTASVELAWLRDKLNLGNGERVW